MSGLLKKINGLFLFCFTLLFVAAMGLGLFLGAKYNDTSVHMDASPAIQEVGTTVFEESVSQLELCVGELMAATGKVDEAWQANQAAEKELQEKVGSMAGSVQSYKNQSDEFYENLLVSRLGQPIYTYNGTNSSIKIFELEEEGYRGYMAKIKLKTSSALKVTMSPSSQPGGETPSQAAKRLGGIFAVNGGGFASSTQNGVTYRVPLGNAMINGELYSDFQATYNDLAFAGFTKDNELICGLYETEEQLKNSGVWQGVSFVPILIKDWEAQTIPSKWANARQPRTVIGQYPNGDVFFVVVDGRQSDWSNGVTLEEMQVLLSNWGIMEALNLDGGGSSAMYYNGSVLNKPSDGTERKMATNIVIMP